MNTTLPGKTGLIETKLLASAVDNNKHSVSDYARWALRGNWQLVSLENAYDRNGKVVALRQVYRDAAGTSTALYHPERKSFDTAAQKDFLPASSSVLDNVVAAVVDQKPIIVAIQKQETTTLLNSKVVRGQLVRLEQNSPIPFLYPSFDREGLSNISALRQTQDEWVPVPVYEFSVVTKKSMPASLPGGVIYLDRFVSTMTFYFTLDVDTNTTLVKETAETDSVQITIKSGGIGFFAKLLQCDVDGALKDVKLYSYSEAQLC